MTVKRMTKESAGELENLYTSITQIYRSLDTVGRPVHVWDNILVFISIQLLDPESIKAWEYHMGSSKDPPTWKQLIEFLMTRLLTFKAVEKSRRSVPQSHQQSVKAHFASSDQPLEASSINPKVFLNKCSICTLSHYARNCPDYINQTVQR